MATAHLLLRGGHYFLPETSAPRRGGIALAETGDLLEAGPDWRLAEWIGPRTRVVELGGRLVTPGLDDAHIHVSEGGLSLLEVDCRGARSEEELAARAAARARELGPGRWVTGRGWDHHLFSGERWPSRGALDRAVPDRPVLLRRIDGHAALANGAALALAGIDRRTEDPPGGRIGRDPATGEPDGLLFENAIDLVRARQPAFSRDDRLAGLRLALRRAREVGLTSLQDERGWPELYGELHEAGELTARVYLWNRLLAPLDELRDWRAGFAAEVRGAPVRPGLLKGYLDGSLGSRTAWFFEPYADDPKTSGMATLDPAEVERLVVAADAAGFQVGLHAIGDRAVTTALDAYAAARARSGPRDARHRIEHAQNVRDADIPRFAELDVVASMQPSHRTGDDAFFRQRLGPARERGAYAWRRLLDAGAPVAFGSDFPVESMDPRTSLAAALSGGVTLAEALDAFTRGAAWARFAERDPRRDWVVWGGNLFGLAPREVLECPVDFTIFEGRIVRERT